MAEERAQAPQGRRGRALFLAADLPWPLDGGGRIATYRVLESLLRRYDVDLVAMADVDGRPELGPLATMCRDVRVVRVPFTLGRHRVRQSLSFARSQLSTEPYRLRKFRSRVFAYEVRDRLDRTSYDLIHCDQFGAFSYVSLASAAIPRVAAHQNVESDMYRLAGASGGRLRRWLAGREAARLARAEPRLLAAFDRVLTLAPEDTELLAAMGIDRVTTLPLPAQQVEAGAPGQPPAGPPRGHRIVSLGSMSWYGVADGLVWFHDRVLPLVRREVPDVEWQIAGPNAPPAIRRFAGEPGIVLSGYVDDVDADLRRARAGIVPLHVAGGVRVKILRFMEIGLPAVSTSLGARGLAFADGQGCFRRDDPEGFAAAVVALLVDDAGWLRAAEAGGRYLAASHKREGFDAAVDAALDAAEAHARRRGSGPGGRIPEP